MSDAAAQPDPRQLDQHVIIAGYGIPGRAVAQALHVMKIPYCVVERNPTTVARCTEGGTPIILGDVLDEHILLEAGIERAAMFAVTLPDDTASLAAVELARRLNPNVEIIARCSYTSGGLEATRRGADEVIVAEVVVAREFAKMIDTRLKQIKPIA